MSTERTEKRMNRFNGESVMLTKEEAIKHDRIFMNELAATLEDKELGIDVTASPFYDPETNSQSHAIPVNPSGSSTVVADSGTTTERFDSQDIQVLSDAALSAAGSFNNWISKNIGFMLLGSVIAYGVYRFGVKRGAS